MNVNHAKVSGVANPAEPGIVGGADWDADHVVAGPFIGASINYNFYSGGTLGNREFGGISLAFTRTGVGTYQSTWPDDLNSELFIMRAVDGAGVHYDLDWENIFGTPSILQVTVRTRAGALVDLADGRFSLIAIIHGV